MLKAHRSKFGGMVRDVAPTDIPQDKYFEAWNMRVVTQGGASTGNIESELGNTMLFTLPDDITYDTGSHIEGTLVFSNFRIVGWTTMRNYILLFTVSDAETGEAAPVLGMNQIWKLEYNPVSNAITGATAGVLTTSHIHYAGRLNFQENLPIEAIARYEHPLLGKVYFVDGTNPYRSINMMDANAQDMTEDQLDILSNVEFPTILPTNTVVGGFYKHGVVQYACMMYRKYGNATAYSPVTGLVPLYAYNESDSWTTLVGGEPTEDTGKGIELEISNIPSNYDYIRIYSLYYSHIYSTPDIHLVGEFPITSTTLNIVDTGDFTKETLTLQEFTFMGGSLYIPYAMEVKDNLMLLFNIKEEVLDIGDYDTRAFRFGLDPVKAYLDGDTSTGISVSGGALVNVPTETADCIPSTGKTYADGYKYDVNGNLGGTGVNISYTIEYIDLSGDGSGNADDRKVVVPNSVSQTWSSALDGTFQDNTGYGDYASVINAQQLVGYQRGETYRFGIVFQDERGRKSFVHWIADIRMPDTTEDGGLYTIADETAYSLRAVYPKFRVDNLDTLSTALGTEVSFSIVRVKRTEQDKTILAQGLLLPVQTDTNNIYDPSGPETPEAAPAGGIQNASVDGYVNTTMTSILSKFGDTDYMDDVGIFITPQILYSEDSIQYQTGDYLQFIGNTSGHNVVLGVGYSIETANGPTGPRELVFKAACMNSAGVSTLDAELDGALVVSSSSENVITLPGASNTKYLHYLYNDATFPVMAYHGGAVVCVMDSLVSLSSFMTTGNYTGSELVYANYIRPRAAQYGGNTYNARASNEYIETGAFQRYYTSNPNPYLDVDCFGGDTYVSYFEYLRAYADLGLYFDDSNTDPSDRQSYQEIMYFPVESDMNLALAHGERYSNTTKSNKWLIQQWPDSTENLTGDSYEQDRKYYLYNWAYSHHGEARRFFAKPITFEDIKEQDCKILVSNLKVNYESIDSWMQFGPNSYTEIDSRYGPIRRGVHYADGIVTVQDNAIGYLSVNERAVTQDANGQTLVLGEGKVIGDHRYLTTQSGSADKFSVVEGDKALYWYDRATKSIGYMTGQSGKIDLSAIRGLSSTIRLYGKGNAEGAYWPLGDIDGELEIPPTGVHAVYDKYNHRVLFTLQNYTLEGDPAEYIPIAITVSFNEMLNAFESFHSYKPCMYLQLDDCVLMLNCDTDMRNEGWVSESGNPGRFFGTYHDASITLVVNSDPMISKVVSNVMYIADVTQSDLDIFSETFNSARVWNGHQNTGEFTLDSLTARRLGRMWRFAVPRNSSVVQYSGTTTNDRSRLVDAYAFIQLIYNHSGKKISLREIVTNYYPVKYI